jgi:hypothetical protein
MASGGHPLAILLHFMNIPEPPAITTCLGGDRLFQIQYGCIALVCNHFVRPSISQEKVRRGAAPPRYARSPVASSETAAEQVLHFEQAL